MNEAIVWCLEQYFPTPAPIEERIAELAEMVAMLKGDGTYEAVDDLTNEIRETLAGLSKGKIGALPDFKDLVTARFEQWQEEEYERLRDKHENPFDDDLFPDDPFPPDEAKSD